MSKQKKSKNPQAFPQWEHLNIEGEYKNIPVENSGMTLRDYFAAQAMASIIPIYVKSIGYNPTHVVLDWESRSGEPEAISELAYKVADEMLKARES